MVRGFVRTLLVGVVLVPAGCVRAPDLLVILDPYLRDVLAAQGVTADQVREATQGIARSRVEVLSAGEGSEEELRELVLRLSPRGVYASPLLAPAAVSAAPDTPDVLFFVDGPLPAGVAAAPNLRVVRYDAAAAYADAGRAVGILLLRPELAPSVRQVVREREGKPLGILSARADRTAQRELSGFLDGLAQTGPGIESEQRELDTLEDRPRVRRHLERMRQEGVDVFLLRTSILTGFCLEVLQKEGGVAVVEGGAGIDAYSDVLLVSFERDMPAAFRAMGAAVVERPADAGREVESDAGGRLENDAGGRLESDAGGRLENDAGGEVEPGLAAASRFAGAGQGAEGSGEPGSIVAPVRLRWWGLAAGELEAIEEELKIHE